MSDDVSKDLVFPEPRVPYAYSESGTAPRGHWTVAEVEEVMWRVRASGGTDSTPVVLGRQEIRATGVEAFPVEVPRAPAPSVVAPAPSGLPRPLLLAAQAAAVLLAAPLLVIPLLYLWSWAFGLVF